MATTPLPDEEWQQLLGEFCDPEGCLLEAEVLSPHIDWKDAEPDEFWNQCNQYNPPDALTAIPTLEEHVPYPAIPDAPSSVPQADLISLVEQLRLE
ncbi:MAG: hypothetical protein M1817_000677 [Caeruleum heppii]|nr:MAG: hypothetical protein M1817_000677 [Caeruleum heppii]